MKKMPDFVAPQLATLVDAVPEGNAWLHELKFDGYRLLCRIDNGSVTVLTRTAQNWTDRFGVVVDAAKKLPARQLLIDGEVVAVTDDGKPSFQLLQNSLRGADASRLIYYGFDLLWLDGRDLRGMPLVERKQILAKILSGAKKTAIRYSEHWIGRGQTLFEKACKTGLEGIVAKRLNAPYRSGRVRSWLKIKCSKSQEFVIGGFTDPAGARTGFGALLLGIHDDRGALLYAGRVGTGFDDRALRDLRARLKPLERRSTPFASLPKSAGFKKVHWVEPKLVCEVVFAAWTSDRLLRHPSFKGLREDKPAREISREVAAPVAAADAPNNAAARVAGVRLTHPDRVLYPDQGITKRDLALYYEHIAGRILPHLKDRPLTVVRCPAGRQRQCFYQRHARAATTAPIRSLTVREKGKNARYLSVDSLPGLIALVQLGVLELHAWGSRAPHLELPDLLTIDLDPGPEAGWEQIREAAARVRSVLQDLELGAFVKSTGGKGLHVVVPITAQQPWDFVKTFFRALAENVVRREPGRYTATASKAKRQGKIFVDYLRNARTATAVCAYSTRARPGAPVAMPLAWEDLEKDPRARFTVRTVPEYLAGQRADPWRDFEEARRPLTAKLLRRLK